jgi:Ser/Thr protein kinase RdoA (MazF antagonist)
MLDQSDIAHYLLSLGLVKPQAIVEEDLTIVDTSRRNCVFVATTRAGPTYVVKQADARDATALANEAAVLRALAGAKQLVGHVPTVVHHDAEAGRLVMRTPGGARDWSDPHGRFPRLPARLLGRALAALHQLPVDSDGLPPRPEPMWGLLLPEPPHELVLDLSIEAQNVVRQLQDSDEVCGRLVALRETCADDALVHGDLRWENCLVLAPPGSTRRTRLLLVDWEHAGPGPAGFDVGTVLAGYLSVWVGSIPIVDPTDPGRFEARARHPLDRMWPAMQAFWSAYRQVSPRPPPLRRVAELTAVRLLQTAVERAQGLAEPSGHVRALVQLAEGLLRNPSFATPWLLGLRE